MKKAFLYEGKTKKALAKFILSTDKLSMGPKCEEFEKAFAKKQGRKWATLFNSGGSANLALLQALKNLGRLIDGDSVGFSALTWSTNVMPIIQLGMKPVAIDCNRETLNVMSRQLLNRLTQQKIQAFFITNALGFTGDLQEIKSICKKNKIILLEDNCESLGTELPAGKAGNFGLASTFSFFVAHHMSTIEGGMICTDDEALAEMLKIVRANGWDRNLTPKSQKRWRKKFNIKSEFESKYTFYDLGFNLRPTEITGFLGLFQLQYLEETTNKRESNFLNLEKIILSNDELLPLNHEHIKRLSTFAIPVICKTVSLKAKYIKRFTDAGIEIRPMIAGNIERQPFYDKYVTKKLELPETDFIHDNGFYCGNYPELTKKDIETIGNCLRQK
ncbi:MAG: DegT/DnrJ/EryC1/StrS aminotransferase family protein [Candidatus Vogelbacteria bacterium]|nr:DegT/DnrJ/EryC1/StrS aminotransferase family protein [Candidatus Vogelbacteria bacterium]